ncbi:MraY family glycosyltransferase [Flavobacterium sp. '19STA2R22 D10 B1']|uniref:MraY family glycosyltransferase n=1 Tax=Flavobacterium aerium TaxID=3037261 RepID=UPI00278C0525|nr:glycosyltransferase family 4 protein [Flavobacterium sp. '19STA2R22 D10 B1']
MEYIFITIILFGLMILYFKVANHFNIIDKPNERSSHTEITLRGGGIIFWITALLYFARHIETSFLFFAGITLVSLVSFWDDIKNLPNRIRISVHFIAITLIFYNLTVFDIMPIWGIIMTYVFAIGIINAYNFMDGINGITGLYTLVVMGSFFYVNEYIIHFTDVNMILYPALASIVFLFFNFRKRAKCFAGDVGSIAIAFWIIYLLLRLIIVTDSIIWLLFLGVYGVDTVCTILHRLYLKQNIFEAHRLHFYQILSNECKIQHRVVSVLYGCMQIIISMLVILLYQSVNVVVVFALILLPLIALYFLKFYFIKKRNNIFD